MSSRILIVEDDAGILVSLEFLVEQAGYEMRVTHTGKEAMAAVADFQPDLILLDVMLPDMTGFEVCRQVRDIEQADSVKILMLTARGGEASRRKGLGLGADRYITKPFSTKDLMREISDLLGADQR